MDSIAAGMRIGALGAFALGCYFVYLVFGELRPSDTALGMKQRQIRENHDIRALVNVLATTMFICALISSFFSIL